jgi:hypothetical protein
MGHSGLNARCVPPDFCLASPLQTDRGQYEKNVSINLDMKNMFLNGAPPALFWGAWHQNLPANLP